MYIERVKTKKKIILSLEFVTNLWVELTLENRLARRGYPRGYKHMIKFILNVCETLES